MVYYWCYKDTLHASNDLSFPLFPPISALTRHIKTSDAVDVLEKFMISRSTLNQFTNELSSSIVYALENQHSAKKEHGNYSLGMFDTFVSTLATGRERGTYYALDVGGTNVRAIRAQLNGDGKIDVSSISRSLVNFPLEDLEVSFGRTRSFKTLPKGDEGDSALNLIGPHVTGKQFFEACCCLLTRIMQGEANMSIALTFSFPTKQEGIRQSRLVQWNKDVETGRKSDDPVEGNDVGLLLQDAMNRLRLRTNVIAVINDTTATMLAGSYQFHDHGDVRMAVIVGTGVNACYFEPSFDKYGYKGNIINTEFGAYNKCFFCNEIDAALDARSADPHCQQLEKCISGAYLGELIRLASVFVLGDKLGQGVHDRHSLPTQKASLFLPGAPQRMNECRDMLFKFWGCRLKDEDLAVIQEITMAIYERAIQLTAGSIYSYFRRASRDISGKTICCVVDGALYVDNEWFRNRLNRYMAAITEGDENKINCCPLSGGSVAGAAVLAAKLTGAK